MGIKSGHYKFMQNQCRVIAILKCKGKAFRTPIVCYWRALQSVLHFWPFQSWMFWRQRHQINFRYKRTVPPVGKAIWRFRCLKLYTFLYIPIWIVTLWLIPALHNEKRCIFLKPPKRREQGNFSVDTTSLYQQNSWSLSANIQVWSPQ